MGLLRLGTYRRVIEESDEADHSPIPMDPRDLRALLELIPSGVDDQDSMWYPRGKIAGRILLLIGIAARDLPEAASVNRAIAFLQKIQKKGRRPGESFGYYIVKTQSSGLPRPSGKRSVGQQRPKRPKRKQSRHPLTNTSVSLTCSQPTNSSHH
jgi:hypothetical protein